MVGDRVTVVLNGEKVVDNVILEKLLDLQASDFPGRANRDASSWQQGLLP